MLLMGRNRIGRSLPALIFLIAVAGVRAADVATPEALRPKGKFETAMAPDTLDLAERARLAINCIVNIIDPAQDYYSSCNVVFGDKVDLHPPTWNLPCEYVFSLPLARTMSGSEQGLDVEAGTMNAYLTGLREDGIIYSPREDLGKPKGSCFPDNIGFVAFALANWHERDGGGPWLDYLHKLCGGFNKMAVRREDRAFFPPEYCYMPDGAWVPEGRGKIAEFDGQEPTSDKQGYEGAVKYYQAASLQALVKNYQYSGDVQSLELAQGLRRFMMKPDFWRNTSAEGYDGAERGIFGDHFHGNLIPLWALLNLGMATDDPQLLQFVRSSYEHARRYVVPGLGWSPCYVYPGNFGTAHKHPFCDGCNVADTIAMAVKLSEAGLGDYWDDAENCLRNQLAESQLIDGDTLKTRVAKDPEGARYVEKFMGGFFQTEPTSLYMREAPFMPGCCIGSGPWGLYFGWSGITRFKDGVASVNMFLNRRAAWLNVESWLPYEGKVAIQNKLAETIMVRVPGWLDPADVTMTIDGKAAQPPLLGRQFVLTGLNRDARIDLKFPIAERSETVHIEGEQYKLALRGSTVVDIEPRLKEPGAIPIYLRDHYRKGGTAPMIERKYFIADKELPLP